MKKYITIFFVVIPLVFTGLQAQTTSDKHDVVASAGDIYVAGDIQLNWTMGEVAIEVVKGFDHLITQGFHQGKFTMANAVSGGLSALEVNLFPNPSFDHVMIGINDFDQEIFITLFDIEGHIIVSENIAAHDNMHKLDLQNLQANTYILQLSSANEDFRSTYKIIKAN
ncbi:MAG: T9SS type A sorting domain-containing protein [Bacteroidetes bacterium]|nr:T9SS type A sorting domain-containing protein [Bacteroidota bacterium]